MVNIKTTSRVLGVIFSAIAVLPGFSQDIPAEKSVTLHLTDVPLRQALQSIADQADVKFVFSDDHVNSRRITCMMNAVALQEALNIISLRTGLAFAMMPARTVVIYREASTSSETADEAPFSANPMRPPVLKDVIEPYYPPLAKNEGLEGRVGIEMLVSSAGRVSDVRISSSSGYRILDRAAMEFARQLTFEPAMQGSRPVETWISRIFTYNLEERTLLPERYAAQIGELRAQLKGADSASRHSVYWSLLQTHAQYCRLLIEQGSVLDNDLLLPIVSEETRRSWQQWWQSEPLFFIVFHDYLRRNPDSPYRDDAVAKMRYFAGILVNRILDRPSADPEIQARQNRFIDDVRTFLKNDYSGTPTES
ncbi:TonB family protein [bacterium]|nr:TonB family protein [bacterium]